MTPVTLPKDRLGEWLSALKARGPVVAPVADEAGQVAFRRLEDGARPELGFVNSVEPPKARFFPRSETLFAYSALGACPPSLEPSVPAGEPWVLFGIRPCDARARLLLDALFDDADGDPYYAARRDACTVVSLFCVEPGPDCFCESMGDVLSQPRGADVLVTPLSDALYVEPLTEKGATFLQSTDSLFGDATEAHAAAKTEQVQATIARLRRHPDPAGIQEDVRKVYGDEGFWDRLTLGCINCGVCTFLCPTCSCFDVMDDAIADAGHRFRCWDTCQFRAFAQEAAGHNPRPERWQRQRQRIAHKLWFSHARFGEISCVGCGRCVQHCPVNVDMASIIEAVRNAS